MTAETSVSVKLLPILSSRADGRTRNDRLEILHALMAAPSFDLAFRKDVVRVAEHHPVYGWVCHVPGCERPSKKNTLCQVHLREWFAARKAGVSQPAFLRAAKPLKGQIRRDQRPCLICSHTPASSYWGVCFLHMTRWNNHRTMLQKMGHTADFDSWLASEQPYPAWGPCQVEGCHYPAEHPLRLCLPDLERYKRDGKPGGAKNPTNWGVGLRQDSHPVPVAYEQVSEFWKWCRTHRPGSRRTDGTLSLIGLLPLVKAEIQWAAFHHTEAPVEGAYWSLLEIQHLADYCRRLPVRSLADLELDAMTMNARSIAQRMLTYLRQVYFTREDSKEAGFFDTTQFGIRFPARTGHIDLTNVTQRWLRDLLWEQFAHRLLQPDPPRTRGPLDAWRRGCAELSAFLEVKAPQGGHDPTLLTKEHMIDFVVDQRHRAERRMKFLGIRGRGRPGHFTPATATKNAVAIVFNGARTVLRFARETGVSDQIGLDRAFIVALPAGGIRAGRRRPFPDAVARALAAEKNLQGLETFDIEDRGLRDIWEGLVVTGRRCMEVVEARLECIARLGGLPMFWHDQTKVGKLDEAIRIPERLYTRIEQRQAKTIARFHQRHGRRPNAAERQKIALFPRRGMNSQFLLSVSYGWFNSAFRGWVNTLDIAHCVPHQARHTLATNLIKNGANLTQVKRYLGQVSGAMAEHYVHLANTDPRLEEALQAVWVAGPGAVEPGLVLSGGEPMSREEAEALAIDLTRKSTPAEGGFCTFQPVVDGNACPWNLDCHNCDKFVLTGADLVYWHRKRDHWRTLAEGAPTSEIADHLHDLFEPTARAITGLEKALEAVGLLDDALAVDYRRPQDYFGRVWATAFRAEQLARHADLAEGPDETADEYEDSA